MITSQTRREKRNKCFLEQRLSKLSAIKKKGMEVEDDVFFADLSKRIALLIMDDDEEFPVQRPQVHSQGFHHMPQTIIPPPYSYEMVYRRECKGTGVFIPRSSIPRRKIRNGKSNSINNSSQKQLNKTEVTVSQATNNNGLHPNNYKNPDSRYENIFNSY